MFGSISVPERSREEWLTAPINRDEFPWLDEVRERHATLDTPSSRSPRARRDVWRWFARQLQPSAFQPCFAPHPAQNFALAASSPPHSPQKRFAAAAVGVPHEVQNFAFGCSPAPHLPQVACCFASAS